MSITPFKLERYFAKYEFSAPYLLSPSDIDPLDMPYLLSLASDERKKQWETLWLGYTESQGHPELLHEISTLYEQVDSNYIIEVVPEEGIFIAMNTLVASGDHMIVMHPGYQSLYEVTRHHGVDVSYWQPAEMWSFDVTQLGSLLQANTKMLVINSPHNPTGAHFTQEEFSAIIEFAREHDLWLFSDEMYRLSEHDAAHRLPNASDSYEKAISLSGVSKSFALPGLRVGWLATQSDEAMQNFIKFKDYTTICSSAPSEILALIALEARQQILERNLKIIHDNLKILDIFFTDNRDLFTWKRPVAGTISFVEWHGDKSITALADDLVDKQGVMLLPASVYDYEGNYFRIGFGRRNLPSILETLQVYLDANH